MSDAPFLVPMRSDADGIPILEEVMDEVPETAIPTLDDVVEDSPELHRSEALKAQLLAELEPQLQHLVQNAFIETVKIVALQMKHNFEQELGLALRTQLADMVDQAVEKAMVATDSNENR